jgi:hypothetical protein
MADLKLDILVVPTYNIKTLAIADVSTYPDDPPVVSSPTIEITIPNFAQIVLPFVVNSITAYTSITLGISTEEVPLPDGIYYIKYSVAPAYLNYVEKSIIRIDRLQEKFDEAFMGLDMMECDKAIKTQAKVELNTVYFFIQGAIAAANNCAIDEATKLYIQADKMLDRFISNDCGCSGNNYQINFQ